MGSFFLSFFFFAKHNLLSVIKSLKQRRICDVLCLHVSSPRSLSCGFVSSAVKPCTGAAQHEGGGQTKVWGALLKGVAQGPVLFLAGMGGGGRLPSDPQEPAGGEELAQTPTGAGLRPQLVSEDIQLAGNPE